MKARHEHRADCGEARDANATRAEVAHAGRFRPQSVKADEALVERGEKKLCFQRGNEAPADAPGPAGVYGSRQMVRIAGLPCWVIRVRVVGAAEGLVLP